MSLRYQPSPTDPFTFFDIKAAAGRDASQAALRGCLFDPRSGVAVHAAVPLISAQHSANAGIAGQAIVAPVAAPEVGLRWTSPTLAVGCIAQPGLGTVSKAWLVSRRGS